MANEYRAVVIGASGAVGSAVVKALLASPRCIGVTTLGRRQVADFQKEPNANKLTEKIIDLSQLSLAGRVAPDEKKNADGFADELAAALKNHEVAFCTLGVGQPSKVSKQELYDVDVNMSRGFGRICKKAGVQHISLLSAVGTEKDGWMHYTKCKWEAESSLWGMGFPRVSIFRPALLQTPEARYGVQDSIFQWLIPKLHWAMPDRWHSIPVSDLGKAFVKNAESPYAPIRTPKDLPKGTEILHWPDFDQVLRGDGPPAAK